MDPILDKCIRAYLFVIRIFLVHLDPTSPVIDIDMPDCFFICSLVMTLSH